jgi:hypothetical protein
MLSFLNESKTEDEVSDYQQKNKSKVSSQDKVYTYQVMRNERLFGNKKLS